MRALAEVGGTVSGAAPGMPEVFAALEVLGTELVHAGSLVGDGAPSLDWRVEGVGGVSVSTAVAGYGDPEATDGSSRRVTTCACPILLLSAM